MGWIKLTKYCERTGETPHSIHCKRRNGTLIDGVHCRVAGDGNLWVNEEAMERWAATSTPENRSGELPR